MTRMSERFCDGRELNIQHPTSNIQHPTSNIQHPTSNIQHPTSNIQHPTSNIQHPTSNIQHPTSNSQWRIVWCRIGCSALDVGCWMFFWGLQTPSARFRATQPARHGIDFLAEFPQPLQFVDQGAATDAESLRGFRPIEPLAAQCLQDCLVL